MLFKLYKFFGGKSGYIEFYFGKQIPFSKANGQVCNTSVV